MRALIYLLEKLKLLAVLCRSGIRRLEHAMRIAYHPKWLALIAEAVLLVTMSITLLFPPYLGLSNDGSFDNVLADTGLSHQSSENTSYFDYYERTYAIASSANVPNTTPVVLKAFVRLAVDLDTFFTRDDVFDLRFLAGIYMLLYLLVLYPFLNEMLMRVNFHVEGAVIAVFCVLVFGDTSIVTRFASFYTQPLELILLTLLLDCVFVFSRERAGWLGSLGMAGTLLLLMNVNPYCALAGVVFSIAYWLLCTKTDMMHRVAYVLTALVLCFVSVASAAHLADSQTKTQKYNQMTRGVLFQADDPEDALAVFQINPRFSILTDTYANQSYPIVDPESGVLDEDFFSKYSTQDVVLYYMWHPVSLLSLFDIGVHNAFITRSDYSGNYEKSAGLPARAKALFLSVWSTFKEQTAPKTAGLVLLVGIAYLIIRKRKKTGDEERDRKEKALTALCAIFFLFSVVELVTALVMTGDSELTRESFLMGCFIDLLSVLFITEILHRLKIFDEGGSN